MKNLKSLGKALNKAEQKQINGGNHCMAPYCANAFGRCVYNHNWHDEETGGCDGQGITSLWD